MIKLKKSKSLNKMIKEISTYADCFYCEDVLFEADYYFSESKSHEYYAAINEAFKLANKSVKVGKPIFELEYYDGLCYFVKTEEEIKHIFCKILIKAQKNSTK